MSQALVSITGLAEVQEALRTAPKTVVILAYADALRAGAEIILSEVASRTPERDEGDRKEDEGHLIDALVCEVEIDSHGRGGRAQIGFSGAQGHKALWVEYGHKLVSHKPDSKDIGVVAPHPFMRPAADAAADAAIAAFAAVLENKLNLYKPTR